MADNVKTGDMRDFATNVTSTMPSSIQVPAMPSIQSSTEFSTFDLRRRTSTISNSRFSPYPSQTIPNSQNLPTTSVPQSTENAIHSTSNQSTGNGITTC